MAKNHEWEIFCPPCMRNSLSEAHVRIKQTTNEYDCVDT